MEKRKYSRGTYSVGVVSCVECGNKERPLGKTIPDWSILGEINSLTWKQSRSMWERARKPVWPQHITRSPCLKTDLFQSCGHCWVFQICWHIECRTFTASSFRIWNSSTGILSPPLALLRFTGSQWLTHDWATDLIWSDLMVCLIYLLIFSFILSELITLCEF